MYRHPGTPDAPVCGRYQSDGNPTLDVSARPLVGLPSLCCEATGCPLQVSRRLHTQQSINRGNEGGEVSTLLEACLQVHFLLRPLRLLQTLIRRLRRMGLGICVPDAHAVNTVNPILPEFTDQEVSLLLYIAEFLCTFTDSSI